MPKANEKDAYYFSHDCNARNDPKILALRSVFGAEGYGVYFMLIEILREQPDYKLQVTKYLYNTLAMQMQVQKERVQEIVDACCNEFTEDDSPLLVNDGNYLYSASLLRRMGRMDDISKMRRDAAKKRWENQACKVLDVDRQSKPDASALHKVSKGNEMKEKEMKGNERREKERKEKKKDAFAAAAGDDAELLSALRAFGEMRVKIKKPMTERAKELMLTELGKLSQDRDTQIAILDQSISHSWAGVFALKDTGGYSPSRSGGRPQQAGTAEKMGALKNLHDAFSGETQGDHGGPARWGKEAQGSGTNPAREGGESEADFAATP